MVLSDEELKEARKYYEMAARGDGFPSAGSVKKAGEIGVRLVEEVTRLRKELDQQRQATKP